MLPVRDGVTGSGRTGIGAGMGEAGEVLLLRTVVVEVTVVDEAIGWGLREEYITAVIAAPAAALEAAMIARVALDMLKMNGFSFVGMEKRPFSDRSSGVGDLFI
jgi:hypothetical protein